MVGGGFSGLATAIWLADFEHEVVLCERHDAVGGRLRGTDHQGTPIDLAPEPLTLPAVLRDLFRKTGRPLERILELIPADPAFRYRFADGETLDLPNTGRGGIAAALDDAFGAGSGSAWQDVIDYGGRVWSAVRSPYLTAEPTRLQRLAAVSSPAARRRLGLDRTLRSLAAARLPPPLGSMLEHRATGVDPRRAPAGLAAIAYVHQTFGRWYVRGGTASLVTALHERAVDRGVAVRTSTAVDAIETSGRRVSGVRLADGEVLDADVVVGAVDVGHLYRDLLRLYRDLLPRSRPPGRTRPHSPGRLTVTLGLDRSLDGAGHPLLAGRFDGEAPVHTVLLSPDTDAALDAVHAAPARPPGSPTIDVHSGRESSHITVRAVVPPHGDDLSRGLDWTARGAGEAYADELVAVLAERGLDLRDRIRWRHVHTPADAAGDTGAAGGGVQGPAITSIRDLAARTNRTPVRGLFHVGRSAYPGPGIPLGGVAAVIVADLIGRA